MNVLPMLLSTFLLAQAPEVELNTLKGEKVKGPLAGLTASEVLLTGKDKLSLSELTDIAFPGVQAGEPIPLTAGVVTLLDGSRLSFSKLTITKDQATIETYHLGKIVLPVVQVAAIRLGPSGAKFDDVWNGIVQKETKQDVLVVKRGDALDPVRGIIGDVGERIQFQLDGEFIPVNPEKAYGLVFKRRSEAVAGLGPRKIVFAGGDVLAARGVEFESGKLTATFVHGATTVVPTEKVKGIDFSSSNLKYLSQLQPVFDESRDYMPTILYKGYGTPFSLDKSLDNQPIRLGGKTYPKGVCLRSRTRLRYRLGQEYTRFQATIGIDQVIVDSPLEGPGGDVFVTISVDGKKLFEKRVTRFDKPQPLDLDIANGKELEILVDYGGDGETGLLDDTGDHFDLADAKLIK